MKHIVIDFLIFALIASSPLYAGNSVLVCEDEKGNPYFSDSSCPTGTERKGRYFAPNVQTLEMDVPTSRNSLVQEYKERGIRHRQAVATSAKKLKLQQIDDELDTIHRKQQRLNDDMHGSMLRRRWAAEEASELSYKRQKLLRQRKNILRGY
jgi:hypothetical protein